jgi:hypothetical protein
MSYFIVARGKLTGHDSVAIFLLNFINGCLQATGTEVLKVLNKKQSYGKE